MTTGRRRTGARRALRWGALLAGIVGAFAAGLALTVWLAGGRLEPWESELDALVLAASGSLGVFGLAVIAYGLVQLAQARRDEARERGFT